MPLGRTNASEPSFRSGRAYGHAPPLLVCKRSEPSDAAHQQEDDEDHDEQADASTRPIAPVPAVTPGGQRADQDQDQDDQQNGAEAHDGALLCGSAWGRPPSLTGQSSQRDNQG